MRPVEILRLRLRCDASAPRRARRAVESLDEITAVHDDVLLVTSELTSSAVIDSGCDPSHEIEVTAELVPDGVRIAVTDTSHRPRRLDGRAPDRHGPGGAGRRVVEALSRRWGSRRFNGGCIWAELPLPRIGHGSA